MSGQFEGPKPTKKLGVMEGYRPENEKVAVEEALGFLSFSAENKSRFQKLAEGAKRFVVTLYERSGLAGRVERARMKSIDKLRIGYNSKLLGWHEKKARKWSSRLSAVDRQIGTIEGSLKGLSDTLENVRAVFGEGSPQYESAFRTIQREKERLELRREGLKNKRDRLQSKLEFRNNKKAVYEERRKEIAKEVSERIRDRLEPYEERIRDLEGRIGRIRERIENFEEMKSRLAERLRELEEKKKRAVSRSEAKIIQGIIEEIKKEQKKAREYISQKAGVVRRLEKKLTRQHKKAAPWRNKLNEFHRISQREVTYWETGEREAVPLNLERRGVTGPKYSSEGEPGPERPASYGRDEGYESREVGKRLSPAEYIKEWNRYFGGEFPLDPEEFERGVKGALRTSELKSFSIPDLENLFRSFYGKQWESRYLTRYGAEKELNKRLRSLRIYLNA